MDRVTKPQKKMLITLLRETKFMEGKKEKEWYWEKIQAALNTIGPKKTIIQWKKCWRDMRLTTRKKLAELKRCQLAGGSPPPGIELNQEDNEIIDIVGAEYFYEEMNGELKPENFMTGFDYVPEHFCDAILTAAAGQQQHMQHQKEQQQQLSNQTQQEHHGNDGETNDTSVTPNNGSFQTQSVGQMQTHSGEHNGATQSSQAHGALPQHPAFHGSLHPQLLRRQNSVFHRELPFEERLLQFMQEAFPKKTKKRRQRDPDRLFLLSLYEEIKRVPEEIRLDVKSELIQILKKYQKKSTKPDKNSTATTISKQSNNSAAQVPHMFQPPKKFDRSEKEMSPQAQSERVNASNSSHHPPQQIPHQIFQMQKKYEESTDKVHQQNEQRKHTEATHSQHSAQPPPSEQHLHHTQLTQGIMFPLTHIRSDQAPAQQHHAHNHHQQTQQQLAHQQQTQQHHTPAIFGSGAPAMGADRAAMPYETVG